MFVKLIILSRIDVYTANEGANTSANINITH
jgi:hypothetical protein